MCVCMCTVDVDTEKETIDYAIHFPNRWQLLQRIQCHARFSLTSQSDMWPDDASARLAGGSAQVITFQILSLLAVVAGMPFRIPVCSILEQNQYVHSCVCVSVSVSVCVFVSVSVSLAPCVYVTLPLCAVSLCISLSLPPSLFLRASLCVLVWVYCIFPSTLHTNIYTYIYIYLHVYIFIYIYMYIYIYIYVSIFSYKYIYKYIYMYIYT